MARSINSRQVRTLLALLALSPGKVVSTDQLVASLWDDDRMKNSKNALQATVTRLRRSLLELPDGSGAGVLRTVEDGYLLDVLPLSVDAFQFSALLARAASLRPKQREEALRHYEAALALWRGLALQGVNDLTALRAEQARLNEGRVGALEACAEIRLDMGHTRMVVTDLRHLVEIHADREQLSELLMLALYRTGQQTEALAVFHRVRARLRSEFGVDPGHRLRRLHRAILQHDPALELMSLAPSVHERCPSPA